MEGAGVEPVDGRMHTGLKVNDVGKGDRNQGFFIDQAARIRVC